MAARMLEDAFYVINPAVRIEKIYMCLSNQSVPESRPMRLPTDLRAYDRHDKILEVWLKLDASGRSEFESELREQIVKQDDVQKNIRILLFLWNMKLAEDAKKVKVAGPPPAKIQRKSLKEDVTSKPNRESLSKPVDSSADRDSAAESRPEEPVEVDDSSSDSSQEEVKEVLVVREIQEVMNVVLRPRTREGRVMLNLRHKNNEIRWVDAQYLLEDYVIEQLREILLKI